MEQFLKRIKSIIKQNAEIAKLKQENFNIFSILRKPSDEEKLHSAFISELLNPKGSHNLGNVFLKLFINEILHQNLILSEGIIVKKEKPIKNGRIDIFISNQQNEVIIIENKIYADDQEGQLYKYHNYLKNNSKNSYLIYLTLDGHNPSEKSLKSNNDSINNDDYIILSYRKDIVYWLELCIKETFNYPTLRETIKQYIFLIKKLTNQLTDSRMKKELFEEIKNNYNEAKLIAQNIEKIEEVAIIEFINSVIKKLKEQFPEIYGWKISNEKLNDKWSGISLQHEDWNKNISLRLEGQPSIIKNTCVFGVNGHKDKVDQNKYYYNIQKLTENKLKMKSPGWIAYKEERLFKDPNNIKKLFNQQDTVNLRNELFDKFRFFANKLNETLKIK